MVSSSQRRAERLRSLLSRSKALYVDTLDGALARCAATLERAAELVEPTVARTRALGAAREEVRLALATAEKVLEHLDAARRFEGVVLDGPQGDNLHAFVMALERLDEASLFLSRHKSGLVAAAAAVESVDALRNDGNVLALREFEATLRAAAQQQQQQQQGLAVAGKRGEQNGKAAAGAKTEEEARARATVQRQRRRLCLLAGALVAGGDEAASSCVKTYCDLRKAAIDAAMAADAVEHKQQMQQQQFVSGFLVDSSRRRARRWCNKLRTLVHVASSEKELAAAIFAAPHRDTAYHSVVAAAVQQVVSAGQSAVSARREPDKMFVLLDMNDALAEVFDDLSSVLRAEQLVAKVAQLADAVHSEFQATFADYEAGLAKPETWKANVNDGVVHPVTAQAVAHLQALAAHKAASRAHSPQENAHHRRRCSAGSGSRAFALLGDSVMLRSLNNLLAGIEVKSRSLNKPLSIVFALNNVQFVVSAVRNSGVLASLPPSWVEAQTQQVEQRLRDLRWALWASVADVLSSTTTTTAPLAKDVAKAVSSALAQVDESRASLAIVDPDLRSRVRSSFEAEVAGPIEVLFSSSEVPQKHLRYTPADVRKMLNDFFELRDDRE